MVSKWEYKFIPGLGVREARLITPEEHDASFDLNLCLLCSNSWSPGHNCPLNQRMQMIYVDIEDELVENESENGHGIDNLDNQSEEPETTLNTEESTQDYDQPFELEVHLQVNISSTPTFEFKDASCPEDETLCVQPKEDREVLTSRFNEMLIPEINIFLVNLQQSSCFLDKLLPLRREKGDIFFEYKGITAESIEEQLLQQGFTITTLQGDAFKQLDGKLKQFNGKVKIISRVMQLKFTIFMGAIQPKNKRQMTMMDSKAKDEQDKVLAFTIPSPLQDTHANWSHLSFGLGINDYFAPLLETHLEKTEEVNNGGRSSIYHQQYFVDRELSIHGLLDVDGYKNNPPTRFDGILSNCKRRSNSNQLDYEHSNLLQKSFHSNYIGFDGDEVVVSLFGLNLLSDIEELSGPELQFSINAKQFSLHKFLEKYQDAVGVEFNSPDCKVDNDKHVCPEVYTILEKIIYTIWNWYYKDLADFFDGCIEGLSIITTYCPQYNEHPGMWNREWRIAWMCLDFQVTTSRKKSHGWKKNSVSQFEWSLQNWV